MKYCNSDSAELAAAINAMASMMAKGKSVEEIEMAAILFDMLSDTLFAIALLEKKQHKLRELRKNQREHLGTAQE
ncbi:MAG: hypothetical protein FWH07_05500 [Oscillospiraceae bacterium]|nr:hypothetical protein [Oscillospiraceae bacterium]